VPCRKARRSHTVRSSSGRENRQADVFWGGEGTLFDLLAEQNLLDKVTIPKAMWDEIPATIGKPVGLPLKDPKGFWVGTTLEPYGLIYQPKLLQRLGVTIKDWTICSTPNSRATLPSARRTGPARAMRATR